MKTTIFGGVIVAFIFISLVVPGTSQALSCVDPTSMIKYYVENDSYDIFTATAGEQTEFVKEAAATDGDPNGQFDSGYTGQYVSVSEAHKGYPADQQWVYWKKNSTWGYLCAGAPPEPGSEALYIVSQGDGLFNLPQIVNVYPSDSPLAAEIIAALEAVETDSEPTIQAVSKDDWQNRLRTDVVDMIFIIRVKLAEWVWWNGQ